MVKRVIRVFVIESTSLYLASQIAEGLSFSKGLPSLLATGLALTIATFLVKPVINILILPINLVTFNFFKWASHAITLFIVDLILPEFAIVNFKFSGFSSEYFTLPPLFLENSALSYLAFSFLIAFIAGLIYWIIDKK